MLIMDQKVTTQAVLGELDARGVKFATLRMRSASLMKRMNSLAGKDYTTITLGRPGPGYATATPGTLQRRFLDTAGTITSHGDIITVTLNRRAYPPVLHQSGLPAGTTIPWWHNRRLRFQLS
jgi:hypothetical protein